MDQQTLEDALFDKNKYYEKITRNIRWAAIAFVLLTFPFDSGGNSVIIYSLIASSIAYNGLRYIKPLLKIRIFGSFISMNLIDNLFSAVLIYETGGLSSPYYFFLILMVVTATYWYGFKGLIVTGTYNVLLGAYFYLLYSGPTITHRPWIQVVSIAFFAILIGYMVERLTGAERQERLSTEEANEEIETERQRLEALVNSLGNGVVAIDTEGDVLLYNGAALELLNTNEDMRGKPLHQFLMLEDSDGKAENATSIAIKSNGVVHRNDLLFTAPDGSKINIDITISPIHGIGGSSKEQGYILVLRDITKEKSLEQSKDEFVSVTSHELRTPIAITEASISTVQALLRNEDNDKVDKLLNTAHDNVVFLGSLVADLSTLARAERGVLDVDLEMVDPNALMQEIKSDYEDKVKERGLKLAVKPAKTLKPILTSKSHIQEILQNFITNSLKYTKKGSITVSASESEKYKGGIRFSVKDTGIGISASDKKKVFDKFFRSEDYRTRETGGTGLGLYITRKLAERLSGDISFDSKLNEGSTFYLDIPPVSKKKEDRSKVVKAQVDDFVSTL